MWAWQVANVEETILIFVGLESPLWWCFGKSVRVFKIQRFMQQHNFQSSRFLRIYAKDYLLSRILSSPLFVVGSGLRICGNHVRSRWKPWELLIRWKLLFKACLMLEEISKTLNYSININMWLITHKHVGSVFLLWNISRFVIMSNSKSFIHVALDHQCNTCSKECKPPCNTHAPIGI